MAEVILFGGTSEGRILGELLGKKRIDTLLCVATEYGEALIQHSDFLHIHKGRLDQTGMAELLKSRRPGLVVDATHPYANQVSGNISAACQTVGLPCLRLRRASLGSEDCVTFSSLIELIAWLQKMPGTIFSTLGAKEAAALTAVSGFQERVWLRILPDAEGLTSCLSAGFPARHIVCMQGPFSQELNSAMFHTAKASILLTKESGAAGGYAQKIAAARECGMTAAVLTRPCEEKGVTMDEILAFIEENII